MKTLRLSESELVKLIKKVILEQDLQLQNQQEGPKWETLTPPVQIQISDDYHDRPLLWDLTQISKRASWCELSGKPRGVYGDWKPDKNYGDGFVYDCSKNTFTSNMVNDNRAVSDAAKQRVRQACGCDEYVKNKNISNQTTA